MYDPDHIEYAITSGHIQIALEDGSHLPAYWAHPALTARFPGIALIHDWWGVTESVRQLAPRFAQTGYYVIVPDLFEGRQAATPAEALTLLRGLGAGGYRRIHMALSVLETHHQSTGDVAAVGLGMGGGLAFEAAIMRDDLEAAVAFGGFPQRYLGHFGRANTPILAFYGGRDEYIPAPVIAQLQAELASLPLAHQVLVLDDAPHDLFADADSEAGRARFRFIWHHTLSFIEALLAGPTRPPPAKIY